jgi:hypothetical protein
MHAFDNKNSYKKKRWMPPLKKKERRMHRPFPRSGIDAPPRNPFTAWASKNFLQEKAVEATCAVAVPWGYCFLR